MLPTPRTFGIGSLKDILVLRDLILTSEFDEIDLDCSALAFVDPVGICMLAWIAAQVEAYETRLHLHHLRRSVAGYLHRMDAMPKNVVHAHSNLDRMVRNDRRGSLVELNVVAVAAQADHIAQQLATAVVGRMQDVPADDAPDEMTGYRAADYYTIPLQYVFSELLDNCLTHGRAGGYRHAKAWVCAQYYPSKDLICVAILDDGCGLLHSLRGHSRLPEQSHAAAIETAILPRVSRNRDLEIHADSANQGLGLTISRRIALQAGGEITIFTGDALRHETAEGCEMSDLAPLWQGVGVYAQIPRRSLRQVDIPSIVRTYLGQAKSPVTLRFED